MRVFTSVALAAALGLGGLVAAPTIGQAQVGIGLSVGFAPPPLPVYDQPDIPGYGYIWTPGYWAWNPEVGDYYWVPGTWVLPPQIGYLWTPAWWGWDEGAYVFHGGYWGPHIGFYGGINYGFGYTGYGYQGGYWRGRDFFYNRDANHIRDGRIRNMFERRVIETTGYNRVSYNGGRGGIALRPTPAQMAVQRELRIAPTGEQMRHVQMATTNRSFAARVNHGAPPIAATPRPAAFVPSRQDPGYHGPAGGTFGQTPRTQYPGANPVNRATPPHPGYQPPADPGFQPQRPAYQPPRPAFNGGQLPRPSGYPIAAPAPNRPQPGEQPRFAPPPRPAAAQPAPKPAPAAEHPGPRDNPNDRR
jgi:hypothetical protein